MQEFRQAIERLQARARIAGTEAPEMPGQAPELDSERVMEQVRAEIAARPIKVPRIEAQAVAMPRAALAPGFVARRDAYTLHELLTFNDVDFVLNAYRAILQREADTAGFTHHIGELYQGNVAKAEILGKLRWSPEGRQKRVRVRGLRVAYWVHRIRRIPLIGGLLGIALYAGRLPMIVRNLERQEVLALRRERELRVAVDALATCVEATTNALTRQTAGAVEAIGRLMTRLNEEKASRHLATDLTENLSSLRLEVSKVSSDIAARTSYDEVLQVADSAFAAASRLASGIDALDAAASRLASGIDALDKAKADSRALAEMFTKDRIEATLRGDDHRLDDFYVAFEDHFRGSREEIKERVAIYLPIVKASAAGTPEAPVLDIGCGRGEWIELLKDSGLVAQGLDLNLAMVRQCRERGLNVAVGDAIDYLRALEPNSLGAITGIHVIEHLPFERRITLFDEALRTLRPGGVVIFETPNPENLIVGACNFWFDPTHMQPLPPDGTRFIAESRGFTRVEIMRLHPYPAEVQLRGGNREVRDKLNAFLYSAQDYSLVAYKA